MGMRKVAQRRPAGVLSYAQFRARFTAEEWAAVQAVADAAPGTFMDWIGLALEQGVHLQGTETGAFMTALVDAEILTAERRAEILA